MKVTKCSRLSCHKEISAGAVLPVITVQVSWVDGAIERVGDPLRFCDGKCAKIYLSANL